MSSPSTILTLGYGSFGSVNLLPTLGYGAGVTADVEEQEVGLGGSGASGEWLYSDAPSRRVVQTDAGRLAVGIRLRSPDVIAGSGGIRELNRLRVAMETKVLSSRAAVRGNLNRIPVRLRNTKLDGLSKWLEDPVEELLLLGLYDPREKG